MHYPGQQEALLPWRRSLTDWLVHLSGPRRLKGRGHSNVHFFVYITYTQVSLQVCYILHAARAMRMRSSMYAVGRLQAWCRTGTGLLRGAQALCRALARAQLQVRRRTGTGVVQVLVIM